MTYSLDFRKKVLAIKEEDKLSFTQVAERFKIGRSTAFEWSKNIEMKKKRNRSAPKINREELIKDVEKYPDSYNYERAERFGVSTSGIQYALKALGFTYKKNAQSPKGRYRKKSEV